MSTSLLKSIPLKEQHLSKLVNNINADKSPEYNEMDGLTGTDVTIRIYEINVRKTAPETSQAKKVLRIDPPHRKTIIGDIIGKHHAIKDLIDLIKIIAPASMIVSLRGATGTGKDLFARTIHAVSGRQGQFIPISCASLPEQLMESELFGYVGGSFTGCRKEGKPRLFEIAQKWNCFFG